MVKGLESRVKNLKTDQLKKLVGYVDADLLRIGTGEEMQEFVGTARRCYRYFPG